MENLIQPNQLKDADIFLYHGDSFLSRAIRYFDGTEYNHASLYMGANVAEAIAQGVVERNISESIANSQPVTVFRLIKRPDDMSPVLLRAHNYIGKRYAYEQLLLLALICTLRRIRKNNPVFRFVEKLLETAAGILLNLTNGNREALICSEFVYRSYNEAIEGYNDPYDIKGVHNNSNKLFESSFYGMIDEESVFSVLYGYNRDVFDLSLPISPYPDKKDFELLKTQFSLEKNMAELELLFENAVQSYIEEDYQLDVAETLKLKQSLNAFILADYTNRNAMDNFNFEQVSPSDILDSFLRTNANFVTPGDLSKAVKLQKIGRIK